MCVDKNVNCLRKLDRILPDAVNLFWTNNVFHGQYQIFDKLRKGNMQMADVASLLMEMQDAGIIEPVRFRPSNSRAAFLGLDVANCGLQTNPNHSTAADWEWRVIDSITVDGQEEESIRVAVKECKNYIRRFLAEKPKSACCEKPNKTIIAQEITDSYETNYPKRKRNLDVLFRECIFNNWVHPRMLISLFGLHVTELCDRIISGQDLRDATASELIFELIFSCKNNDIAVALTALIVLSMSSSVDNEFKEITWGLYEKYPNEIYNMEIELRSKLYMQSRIIR